MSLEKDLGYSGLGIVVGLAAWFIFPFVAIVAIPGFIIYGIYSMWANDPSRLERIARKHTWQLYEDARENYGITEDIGAAYDYFLFEIPAGKIEQHYFLKRLFIRLWEYEGYSISLEPPPVVCNSIEGGRYRDRLSTIHDNTNALAEVASMANMALNFPCFDERMSRIIGRMILNDESGKVLFPKTARKLSENYDIYKDHNRVFEDTIIEDITKYMVPTELLPYELRTHHHHIVAGSGSGKTQCLQQMILHDVQYDLSMVIIDSQGDLIKTLATRISPDRLILIDPEHCPPALNLFQSRTGEKEIATAIEMYEYIFSSLETDLTTKQSMVYRFVSRLLMTIPNATIHTMLEILEDGGAIKYQKEIDHLGVTAKSFFTEFNKPKQSEYSDTRRQVKNRLYTVLENKTLESMLGATDSRLNINEALDNNKVILISTAKGFLKQTGASLLGRIFIAQVMQAVMARGENRKRVHLYIDEFQDYAEDSHVLFNLFEQARKYNLGLIIAHQYLGQLPTQLQQSISANTAIKFARGVSADDARVLAKQMNVTPEFIQNQNVGDFASYLKDMGTTSYHVEFGKLEKMPEINKISDIHEDMRKRYGVKEVIKTPPVTPTPEPITPEPEPEEETDDLDRSKW